jgi:hypothetical protein
MPYHLLITRSRLLCGIIPMLGMGLTCAAASGANGCAPLSSASGLLSIHDGATTETMTPPNVLSFPDSTNPVAQAYGQGPTVFGGPVATVGASAQGLAPDGSDVSASAVMNFFVEACGTGSTAPLYVYGGASYQAVSSKFLPIPATGVAQWSLSTPSGTFFTLQFLANGPGEVQRAATFMVPANTPIEVSLDVSILSTISGSLNNSYSQIFSLGAPPAAGDQFTYVYSPGFVPRPPLPEPGTLSLALLGLAGVVLRKKHWLRRIAADLFAT